MCPELLTRTDGWDELPPLNNESYPNISYAESMMDPENQEKEIKRDLNGDDSICDPFEFLKRWIWAQIREPSNEGNLCEWLQGGNQICVNTRAMKSRFDLVNPTMKSSSQKLFLTLSKDSVGCKKEGDMTGIIFNVETFKNAI